MPEGVGSDWDKGLNDRKRGNLLEKSRQEFGLLETNKTNFFGDISIRIQSFELGTRNLCYIHKTRGRQVESCEACTLFYCQILIYNLGQ